MTIDEATSHQGDKPRVILAITGSIAAYKAAHLCRLLVKKGADVRILMTKSSAEFISPLTMSTLSNNKVGISLFEEGEWVNHVEYGLWADVMVIAPCTAHTIAKMANGICDNIVMATYLSAKCPTCIAPAMDLDMWTHPTTERNLRVLEKDGVKIIPVGDGFLASGLYGEGRMAEPETIVQYIVPHFSRTKYLQKKTIIITAGPTYEALDPVRFIGNRSSGKMGLALAESCIKLGAQVTLILGPSHLDVSHIPHVVRVQSADEMYQETMSRWEDADIAIMAAAVADYTPCTTSPSKIKKKEDILTVQFCKTKDILKSLGVSKKPGQTLIGFALETDNEIENATHKLISKKADYIILNSMRDKEAGFEKETNKVTIINKNGVIFASDVQNKKSIAELILQHTIISDK